MIERVPRIDPATRQNPAGFSCATLKIIDFLGGDRRSGMCRCPCHDDQTPSLSVANGDRVAVLVRCFAGCSWRAIVAYLRAHGAWPSSSELEGVEASPAADQSRSPDERIAYARKIHDSLKRHSGREMAHLLRDYMHTRGLHKEPATALITLPPALLRGHETDRGEIIGSHDPGMVLTIRNRQGFFQGIHVTWLNANLTDKREQEPQRQTYGYFCTISSSSTNSTSTGPNR
jgi:hypothetical protein